MDILTREERSHRMRLVRSSGTKPERVLRNILSEMGYRYRCNLRTLPGSPDFAFPSRKKAVFVHGCFWHQHAACRRDGMPRSPKSRLSYWERKLARNQQRDHGNQRRLNRMGWSYLVLWECRMKSRQKLDRVQTRVRSFLDRDNVRALS